MASRRLRIMSYVQDEYLRSVREKCNTAFKVASPDYDGAKTKMEAEFAKHKCPASDSDKPSTH